VGLNVNRRDSLAEAMTEAIDPDAMATAFRETIEASGQDSPADASSSVDAAFAPQVRQPGSRSTADRVASARKKE
jgi:thiazole synthase ThiGH ThiG subunit